MGFTWEIHYLSSQWVKMSHGFKHTWRRDWQRKESGTGWENPVLNCPRTNSFMPHYCKGKGACYAAHQGVSCRGPFGLAHPRLLEGGSGCSGARCALPLPRCGSRLPHPLPGKPTASVPRARLMPCSHPDPERRSLGLRVRPGAGRGVPRPRPRT